MQDQHVSVEKILAILGQKTVQIEVMQEQILELKRELETLKKEAK